MFQVYPFYGAEVFCGPLQNSNANQNKAYLHIGMRHSPAVGASPEPGARLHDGALQREIAGQRAGYDA